MLRKGVGETHPLFEFFAGLRLWPLKPKAGRTRVKNFQFCFESVCLNLRTGRQIQKFVRLLSISPRFKVAAVSTGCDDHIKLLPPWFLNVEHVSPILDARNSLVLRQFPTTSVWFDPAHGVHALMCAPRRDTPAPPRSAYRRARPSSLRSGYVPHAACTCSGQLYPDSEDAAPLALEVSDLSFGPNAIP
jgi:hypothetical protein